MDVLELDPRSPLKALLSQARTHIRSFYEAGRSSEQMDGAVCIDITALRLSNDSVDLIVSSDEGLVELICSLCRREQQPESEPRSLMEK